MRRWLDGVRKASPQRAPRWSQKGFGSEGSEFWLWGPRQGLFGSQKGADWQGAGARGHCFPGARLGPNWREGDGELPPRESLASADGLAGGPAAPREGDFSPRGAFLPLNLALPARPGARFARFRPVAPEAEQAAQAGRTCRWGKREGRAFENFKGGDL